MTKVSVLRVVNIMLALAFFTVLTSVILMKAGIINPTVFEVHETAGGLMLLLAATHLWLNWGWVRANILKRRQHPPEKVL